MQLLSPPMGWNSWNTFGPNISDSVIRSTAQAMKNQGYLDAGYQYIVIDDCWQCRERDAQGRLVPDPAKFPFGIKSLADYVHSLGFKFGIYSCAGVRTCAGFPGSFDHEFIDAQTFADWGVDYLKYDFCNFPESASGQNRYATMSLALKATGREILFAACNWGFEDCGKWIKARGAHMYRSTGDIYDNFASFWNIAQSQLGNFCMSGHDCFNDLDMLTIGMYGNGNAALGQACTDEEYVTQFALWCMLGAPLMLGGDVRNLNDFCKKLVTNPGLLRIGQDPECRPPFAVYQGAVVCTGEDVPNGYEAHPDAGITLFRHLSDSQFAIGYFNSAPRRGEVLFTFVEAGLPYQSNVALKLTDALTGEDLGIHRDYYNLQVPSHGCRILLAELVHI